MSLPEQLNQIPQVEAGAALEEFAIDPESAPIPGEAPLSAESIETLDKIASNPETPWESAYLVLDEANNRVVEQKAKQIEILDRTISDARKVEDIRSSLGLTPSDETPVGIEEIVKDTAKVIELEQHIAQLESVVMDTRATDPVEGLEVSRLKEARTQRLLSEVCARNNQFILHGIRVDKNKIGTHPEENSQIEGDASFAERVKILRALKPEISCSSFRAGEAYEGGWSAVGVLLSGGEVVHAERGDAGTKAAEDGTRQIIGERKNSPKEIDEILSAVDNTGHNELIVRNPMIAGLYVNFDKLRDDLERETNVEWQSKQAIASFRSKMNGTSDREELNKIADDPEYERTLTQEEMGAIEALKLQLRERAKTEATRRALKNLKQIHESNDSGLPQFMIVDGIPKEVAEWDEQGPIFIEDIEGGVTPQTLSNHVDSLSIEDRKDILASIPDTVFRGGKGGLIPRDEEPARPASL